MKQDSSAGGCLTVLLRLVGIDLAKWVRSAPRLPYRLRDDFLSPAERSFYGVLAAVLGDRAVICPKVRVADLLFVPRLADRAEESAAFNRISAKHVDFVLCSPGAMRPVAAIELDDSSHDRPDRRERDRFLESAFAAVELPLLRFPVRRQYDLREIAAALAPILDRIDEQIDEPPVPASQLAAAVGPGAPNCPRCGGPTVLRTAKSGSRAGGEFYGCADYPRCRGTRPAE